MYYRIHGEYGVVSKGEEEAMRVFPSSHLREGGRGASDLEMGEAHLY